MVFSLVVVIDDSWNSVMSLKLTTLELTPFYQNTRIIFDDEHPEKAVVVDPGGEASKIERVLKKHGLVCRAIWLTHSHLDHCGGVRDLVDAFDCDLYGHPEEMNLRRSVEDVAALYGLSNIDMKNCPEPNIYISSGDSVECGGYMFEVKHTPGHSPGHIIFYCEKAGLALVGDVIFNGSIGRTDLPGGNYEELMRSIKNHILTLPANTRLLTGHGPETTVGAEAESNPFLLQMV